MPRAVRIVLACCRTRAAAAVLAAAAGLALPPAAAPAAPARVPPDPGVIVGARAAADVEGLVGTLRAARAPFHPLPRIDALLVPRAGAEEVRRLLAGDARVRWIEPTRPRTLLAEPSAAVDPATGRAYGWAFDAVGAGDAIAAAGGGSAARVAVVDSGVDASHPDLAGRVGPARDIVLDDDSPADPVGHGTFIAGLVAAVEGNGIGTRGVAGATTVLPVRVTTDGSITSASAAAGIVAAVDAGASVVNISFGGARLSAAERAALDYAASRDVLVVAAAGNTGGGALVYPAAAVGGSRGGWSAGISVAAVDPAGQPASFSTWNDAVTISAPGAGSAADCGDGVYSTIPERATLWPAGTCLRTFGGSSAGGRYGYAEGTSFAAPIVAGGAALVRGVNPALTAAQTADVLRDTARQTSGAGWNPRTGAGVADLAAAVAAARRYDVTAPAPTLTAVPAAGGVIVSVDPGDTAAAGAERAPVMSVHLEGSSDGAAFTALAPDATGAIRVTDGQEPGTLRRYRVIACDANRNCGTAVAGPVAAGAAGDGDALLASVRPGLASVRAQRMRGCGACVRIAFAARGRGPLAWRADIAGAGVRLQRRGRLPTGRRHVVRIRLPRLPACGGRLTVTLRLASPLGRARARRTVPVRDRCARPAPGRAGRAR